MSNPTNQPINPEASAFGAERPNLRDGVSPGVRDQAGLEAFSKQGMEILLNDTIAKGAAGEALANNAFGTLILDHNFAQARDGQQLAEQRELSTQTEVTNTQSEQIASEGSRANDSSGISSQEIEQSGDLDQQENEAGMPSPDVVDGEDENTLRGAQEQRSNKSRNDNVGEKLRQSIEVNEIGRCGIDQKTSQPIAASEAEHRRLEQSVSAHKSNETEYKQIEQAAVSHLVRQQSESREDSKSILAQEDMNDREHKEGIREQTAGQADEHADYHTGVIHEGGVSSPNMSSEESGSKFLVANQKMDFARQASTSSVETSVTRVTRNAMGLKAHASTRDTSGSEEKEEDPIVCDEPNTVAPTNPTHISTANTNTANASTSQATNGRTNTSQASTSHVNHTGTSNGAMKHGQNDPSIPNIQLNSNQSVQGNSSSSQTNLSSKAGRVNSGPRKNNPNIRSVENNKAGQLMPITEHNYASAQHYGHKYHSENNKYVDYLRQDLGNPWLSTDGGYMQPNIELQRRLDQIFGGWQDHNNQNEKKSQEIDTGKSANESSLRTNNLISQLITMVNDFNKNKKQKQVQPVRVYTVQTMDTLESIAVNILRDRKLGFLLYLINQRNLVQGQTVEWQKIKLLSGTIIYLPSNEEIIRFRAVMPRGASQSNASDVQWHFNQQYGRNVEDRRNNVERLLGPLTPLKSSRYDLETGRHLVTVRLGDTLRSIALKHPALKDVSLWKLLASCNNLSKLTDANGVPTVILTRGMILQIPGEEEIIAFRAAQAAVIRAQSPRKAISKEVLAL